VKGLRNTSIHQLRAISCRADNKVETISCRADKQQQSFLDPSKVGGRSTKNIKKKSYKWVLRQEQGNNYCGYYVCEFIMVYAKRTPEEILKVRYINIFIYSQFLLFLIYISNHVTNTYIY